MFVVSKIYLKVENAAAKLKRKKFPNIIRLCKAMMKFVIFDLSQRILKILKRSELQASLFRMENIVLLFENFNKNSLFFLVALNNFRYGVTYLDPGSSQMGKKNSLLKILQEFFRKNV